MIDIIRLYRNISAHPYDFLRGKNESNFIINNGFYLLNLIKDSGALK